MAYEVTLSSGEAVILKVAPANGIRVMTYERNIMCAEVQAMEMALEHGGIPVPKVLGYDDSHTICWGDPLLEVGFRIHSDNLFSGTVMA